MAQVNGWSADDRQTRVAAFDEMSVLMVTWQKDVQSYMKDDSLQRHADAKHVNENNNWRIASSVAINSRSRGANSFCPSSLSLLFLHRL